MAGRGLFRRPPQPQQRRPWVVFAAGPSTNAAAEFASGTGAAHNATTKVAPGSIAASGTGAAATSGKTVAPAGRAVGDLRARGVFTLAGGTETVQVVVRGSTVDLGYVATLGNSGPGLVGQLYRIDTGNEASLELDSIDLSGYTQDQQWVVEIEINGVSPTVNVKARFYPTDEPPTAWLEAVDDYALITRNDDTTTFTSGGAVEDAIASWGSPGGWGNAITARGQAGASAAAGHAAGTGAAGAPSVRISNSTGLASGTGAANNATVATADTGIAETASGTGSAFNITSKVTTNAAGASGTGVANGVDGIVAPTAGHAAGTGAANDATTTSTGDESVSAGHAAGTGAAYPAAASTQSGGVIPHPPAGAAIVTGPARPKRPHVRVRAGLASGTGRAFDANVDTNDDDTAMLLILEAA